MRGALPICRFAGPAFLFLIFLTAGSVSAQRESIPQLEADDTTDIWDMDEPRVRRGEVVVFGRDVRVEAGESVRALVVIGGNAVIEGRVEGDVVVLLGSAEIEGEVGGGLMTVLGGAKVGSEGVVLQETFVIGGRFEKAPGARVERERVGIVFGDSVPDLRTAGDLLLRAALMARPLPPEHPWVWWVAFLFYAVYATLAVMFPRVTDAAAAAIRHRPAATFGTGLLVCVLSGPLIFLLAISVVGIPLIPLFAALLVLAVVFAKVPFYRAAGERLLRLPGLRFLQNRWLALTLGCGMFFALYTVPVAGLLAWLVATIWGLGALIVGSMRPSWTESHPAIQGPALAPAFTGELPRPGAASPALPAIAAIPPKLSPGSEVDAFPERAGLGIRVVAILLDWAILALTIPVLGPGVLLAAPIYFVGLWMGLGATVGGVVAGIRVVRLDGGPIDLQTAAVRCLSGVLSTLVLFLGFVQAGVGRQKLTWHDRIAGTAVVKAPPGLKLV